MLEATGLECIRGARPLFAALSFRAAPGTLLRVEGSNGSGKTSLLRLLCGLLHPHAGDIQWQGTPIAQLGESYRDVLLYLGHQNALKDDLDGIENLRFAVGLHGISLSRDAALAALESIGVAHSAHRPVRLLSQGQKRRVALAILAVRTRCRVWLLDEPFVALDTAAVSAVARSIAVQVANGGIVIYTTHQDVALDTPHTTLRLA